MARGHVQIYIISDLGNKLRGIHLTIPRPKKIKDLGSRYVLT